jgi:hypothetical protein
MSIPSTHLTTYHPGDRQPNQCDACKIKENLRQKIIVWKKASEHFNRNFELLLCSTCFINIKKETTGESGKEALLNALNALK